MVTVVVVLTLAVKPQFLLWWQSCCSRRGLVQQYFCFTSQSSMPFRAKQAFTTKLSPGKQRPVQTVSNMIKVKEKVSIGELTFRTLPRFTNSGFGERKTEDTQDNEECYSKVSQEQLLEPCRSLHSGEFLPCLEQSLPISMHRSVVEKHQMNVIRKRKSSNVNKKRKMQRL